MSQQCPSPDVHQVDARRTERPARLLALAPTPRREREMEARLDRFAARFALSPKQIGVLRMLLLGFSNKEIAVAARCSEVTIEAHMTSLLRRTGSGGRALLVARFWLELDDVDAA